MQEIVIRGYCPQDRQSVREIAWDTALMGEPAAAFFDGREVFEDFLTRYFTDYEPQSCFVAQINGQVCGYLLGAKDASCVEKVFSKKILAPALIKAFKSGVFLKGRNLRFFFNMARSILRREFSMPDFSKEYPATLHINLKKSSRGLGIGSKLIAAFLDYLSREKVEGIHLATFSEEASFFFRKNGFSLIYQGKRSYFRHILKKDIALYIYAKKLR